MKGTIIYSFFVCIGVIITSCILGNVDADITTNTCKNGVKDDNEADIDCGNECFALCDIGMHCNTDFDCNSWRCNTQTYKCIQDKKMMRFLSASGASGVDVLVPCGLYLAT